jgi:predicted CXXCH cytochrome family protein
VNPLPFILLSLAVLLSACRPQASRTPDPTTKVIGPELRARSVVPSPVAEQCAECHAREVEQWRGSHHAWANRLVDPALDRRAYEPPQSVTVGSVTTRAEIRDGRFEIAQNQGEDKPATYVPEAVIGFVPLIQYLVPFPGGRLQVVDMGYEPGSGEWFNVFGNEDRQPHEWGFWTNRGNNWNSQCAFCHMTGFRKNYDPASDEYRSTWDEMGISCAQCHGPMDGHLAQPQAPVPADETLSAQQITDNCASCHSRRAELTGQFHPGEDYSDHFALVFAHQPEMYYPDGQVLAEDFVYGSFMMSRMGHRGITCLDCHNPHSGELSIPIQNNALCISCHQAPGRKDATVIDVATHSHHPPGSSGNACIECHMPSSPFMQRDPRRDHGFSSPDPRMTEAFGIPNACNRCHTDQSVAWAAEWAETWYGRKLTDGRARRRTRAIVRAQAGEPEVVEELLLLIESEEIVYRRATLLALLEPWAEQDRVGKVLRTALRDPHPWIRIIAVQALAPHPAQHPSLRPLRKDPSRSVRIAATRAALGTVDRASPAYREVIAYLDTVADQPAGAIGQAERALTEGRPDDAEAWMRKAVDWDPTAHAYYLLGRTQNAIGKSAEAQVSLADAARLDPENADYPYALALLYAETGRTADALEALSRTVKLDPAFGRAWYNLGLAYAQQGDLTQSVEALRKAEEHLPNSPDPAYARATVHLRLNEWDQARSAAAAALRIAPRHRPAASLLARLQGRRTE